MTPPVPTALLLDFGGLLFSSHRRPHWEDELTSVVEEVLRRAALTPPPTEIIRRDLEVARIAESGWKTGASRLMHPAELDGRVFWGEMLAGDWGSAASAALSAESHYLDRRLVEAVSFYTARPGVEELLQVARMRSIPVGVVSNTHSGEAFRAIIEREGFSELIALQCYSDELGVRKPNPEFLLAAVRALGVSPESCWYGGDHYDRDVMCARRAGIGVAVLVHDEKTNSPPYPAQGAPDIEVATPGRLADALRSAPVRPAPGAPPAAGATARPARPAALLLDHGGVIVDSHADHEGRAAFVGRLAAFLEKTGWNDFDLEQLAADVEEGHRLHGELKEPADDSSPLPEVSHIEFWRDLVGGGWPAQPRAAVAANARGLMVDHISTRSVRSIRPGVLDLLAYCRAEGIPVGVVSNTLCGASARGLSQRFGTAPYLGVEIYSDELGRRKPDKSMIEAATTALGVDPGDCWYVGDKPERDLACGRRAGIGKAVLMRRPQDEGPFDADLVVEDASELLAALRGVLS